MFARILTYSHDSYGLGHFRRSLTIADYLLSRSPETSVLALTGSPRSHSFHLPHRFDYVKLPAATKNSSGAYEARELDLALPDLVQLRSDILRDCGRSYRPDLLLVDHVPAGLGGELLPLLKILKAAGTRIVLSFRDILDDPALVREQWERDGTIEVLREYYDGILIHGDRDVFDPVERYGIPKDLAAKTHFTGYVVRSHRGESRDAVRRRLGISDRPFALLMAGGGGDGHRLLKTWLRGLKHLPEASDLASLVVTGPLMSSRKRHRLKEMAGSVPGVMLESFLPDLPSILKAADVVVSMGGYNSVAEILRFRRPAVIVPRIHPRREQEVRARCLAERELITWIHPDRLTGRGLLKAAMSCLGKKPPRSRLPGLEGLRHAWEALEAIQAGEPSPDALRGEAPKPLNVSGGED
jgi:predicted glycosyltransferase